MFFDVLLLWILQKVGSDRDLVGSGWWNRAC